VYLPLVFLVSGGIAFSTGTSWGTFAIMLPIAVPAAEALGLPLAPFVAASLAGGVFGDHCSPISDTTIISSMASATDHIDHVRTQLPYALIGGGIAAVAFGILGASL
jgi:tetracycline resistance efflux pump